MRKFVLFLFLVGLVVFLVWLLRSPKPEIEISPAVKVLGRATPLNVHIHAARGVRSAIAEIEQNGKHHVVSELPQPSSTADANWTFVVGATTIHKLRDGKAQLIIEATANGPLHRSSRWQHEITVVTHAPIVTADSDQHYLYLGMADAAIFTVSGTWTEAGVRVGDETFRAWALPGDKPGLFSLYAFAWNMPLNTVPVIYASAGEGIESTSPLVVKFPKKEQPRYTVHDLQLDDSFIQKVVGELDPNGSGDPVARFVRINNEMRRANNQTLSDLRTKTADHFLWSQSFLRQAGAKAEATFADQRNYLYQGKKIDQQVHLGYDLAITQHIGVQASNDGKVVYAAPLGIYGNCIVVDHGYGLQTIYGHLSQISVHEGDLVKRGQIMGLSGQTGMAGGDHIHFSMQLDGIQIDPKEFWDPHWIADHIAKRVPLPKF